MDKVTYLRKIEREKRCYELLMSLAGDKFGYDFFYQKMIGLDSLPKKR